MWITNGGRQSTPTWVLALQLPGSICKLLGTQEHLLRLPYPSSCEWRRGGKPSHAQVSLELNTPNKAPVSAVSPSCTEFSFALPFKAPHSLTQFRLRFSPTRTAFPLFQIQHAIPINQMKTWSSTKQNLNLHTSIPLFQFWITFLRGKKTNFIFLS